jgi:membrane protease YdiL (CAAX protease family)
LTPRTLRSAIHRAFRAPWIHLAEACLLIHVPGWLALHLLRADAMATVFIFGFAMGIAFRYADSLWTPIIVHSTNDFLSFVVFKV